MKKVRWIYLVTALLWVGSGSAALYHHRFGYAALIAATAALNFVLFAKSAHRQ